MADRGMEVTEAMAEEKLCEYFQEMDFAIEEFLEEEFGKDEEE